MTRTQMAVVVIAAVGIVGASLAVAQTEAPPYYRLLPFDWEGGADPYVYHYGVCAIPFAVLPGTPCHCQAANGLWLPGVCTK